MKKIICIFLLSFICTNVTAQDLNWKGALSVYKSPVGESSQIAPGSLIPARPGSTLSIQPYGDYRRGGIDLFPTTGLKPDRGALCELAFHRIAPTAKGVEMMSLAALARPDYPYALVIESTGIGQMHPFTWLFVEQDLNFANHTVYEPLVISKDGCLFGEDVILKSPDGTNWNLSVTDCGVLEVIAR